MEYLPFTFVQATEIAEDFEDLKDTEFNFDTPYEFMIHDVVVSPFHDVDKILFVNRYRQTRDGKDAINFYSRSEFDVLLIAFDVNDDENYTYIKIRDYVDENGINYNFPQNSQVD